MSEQCIFDTILNDMCYFDNVYENCNYLIAGDLNSRVGLRCDFVQDDNIYNLELLPDEYEIDCNLPRKSQDKTSGLRIVNDAVRMEKLDNSLVLSQMGHLLLIMYYVDKICFLFLINLLLKNPIF
ncbi:hypothetical protein MAR_016279 [Mya arenaria]|uniref:Endonuclease/exonuclease/phosphatase domain-containing protein n=1 Tax=Mya arenaria TaxID=6604 RepID=A0ABY7FJP8_MYAAR|nr:hypothetical protein MAR_016279 [Mya arenaria]